MIVVKARLYLYADNDERVDALLRFFRSEAEARDVTAFVIEESRELSEEPSH